MTKRSGRQKTLIAGREIFDLLKAATDLMEHAQIDDYSEARLIRNAVRHAVADLAEKATDDALAELAARDDLPAGELRRIRTEVDARRKRLRDAAARAQEADD